MKKVFIVLLSIFILASCWKETQKQELTDNNTNKEVVMQNIVDSSIERINSIVNELWEDEQNLFSLYKEAQENNDISKIREIEEQFRKIIDTKQEESRAALENWDIDKSRELKQEIINIKKLWF